MPRGAPLSDPPTPCTGCHQVFEDMKYRGVTPTVVTYNTLIAAFVQGKQYLRAQRVFEDMQALGCRPTVVTYTTIIFGLAKARLWERAWELLADMESAGVRPNVLTYITLMHAYQAEGMWSRAIQVHCLLAQVQGPCAYQLCMVHPSFVLLGGQVLLLSLRSVMDLRIKESSDFLHKCKVSWHERQALLHQSEVLPQQYEVSLHQCKVFPYKGKRMLAHTLLCFVSNARLRLHQMKPIWAPRKMTEHHGKLWASGEISWGPVPRQTLIVV